MRQGAAVGLLLAIMPNSGRKWLFVIFFLFLLSFFLFVIERQRLHSSFFCFPSFEASRMWGFLIISGSNTMSVLFFSSLCVQTTAW